MTKYKEPKITYQDGLGKNPNTGRYDYRFMIFKKVYKGTTGLTDKDQARKKLLSLKEEINLQLAGIKKKIVKVTFKTMWKEWLDEHTGIRSPKYIRNITQAINMHVLPYLGDEVVCTIDAEKIKKALKHYLDKGNAKSGYNVVRCYTMTLMSYALTKSYSLERPDVAPIQVQKKKKAVLSFAMVPQFLREIDKQNRIKISIMVRAMLYLGLRENEARLMKWSNIDWERAMYAPDKTKNYDTTDLPIPNDLLNLLKKHKAKAPEGVDWIILGRKGNPVYEQYARLAIMIACAACGITGITNHRLRGSFATLQARNGTDPFTIKEMGRWKSMDTVLIYVEGSDEAKKQASTLWDELAPKENVTDLKVKTS